MRTIVAGLGNDLLVDDAVGILVARRLKQQLDDVRAAIPRLCRRVCDLLVLKPVAGTPMRVYQ